MNFAFDAARGLVVASVEISGPNGSAVLRLALDTGATITLIDTRLLVAVGYDPAAADQTAVTTGSGIAYAGRIAIQKIASLGQERFNFPVLAHTLPASDGVDGVLGLDFLRGHVLTIDFNSGTINLDGQ